jgi:integrase
MAHVYKLGSKWRAQVNRNGVRKSRTFETKAAATLWASSEETEIRAVGRGAFPKKTFADALVRYRDEISVKKRGGPWEAKRITAFVRDFPKLAALQLTAVEGKHLVEWRDARLKVVTNGSVQRDVNVLSNVYTLARDEWGWCGDSPFRGFRAPGENPPRVRVVKPAEIRLILRWLGYVVGQKPETKMAQVGYAFLISLRTGMRAGEVLALTHNRIDPIRRLCSVPHKTQHITGRERQIPLSKHALRVLRHFVNGRFRWSVTSASLDALFRKARHSVLISDLHFHDARAYALTQFAKKVDVMQLARISGHRDLRILMDHYYRITPAEIAAKLD